MNPDRREARRHTPYIELEGETQLLEGQNFYNQPPFAGVIDKLSKQLELPQNEVRENVSKFAGHVRTALIRIEKDLHFGIKPRTRVYPAEGWQKDFSTQPSDTSLRAAEELLRYPSWVEYVNNHLNSSQYLQNGEYRDLAPNKKPVKYIPVETYLGWLYQRSERDRRLRDAAIQVVLIETFPQDLAEEPVQEIVAEAGRKRSTRKYRILEAANILADVR